MSRDSSGNYTAPSNSWNPAVEGTAIDEGDWNSILTDVTSALTESVYTASLGSTDNAVLRADGTNTKKAQGSAAKIDDSGSLLLPASQYVNFGSTAGSSGYGIRDNSGTVEVKNSGGSWSALPGLDWQGAWLTATAYVVGDAVKNGGSSYICTVAHTSDASTEPGTGGSWATVWDVFAERGATGAGTGDMLAANNLSDVANNATAFSNIKQSATETVTGVVELATTAEATTGTDTVRAVTPAGLKAHVDARNATTAAATITDNRIVRGDGGSRGVQESAATLDDSGNLSGIGTLGTSGVATIGTTAATAVKLDPSGFIELPEVAAPSTPASGFLRVYAKSDGKAYQKDDAGTETDLSATGGSSSVINNYLTGLTLSRNSGTPTTKIDIAAGYAADSTNAVMMTSSGTLTVDCTATGANALDTGSLANNTWYHVWLIAKADGTVAGLISTSVSSPTMPATYSYKRRLGSVRTNSSAQFIAFTQDGDYFLWAVTLLDVSTTNPGTSAVTSTLTVPTGVNVHALINAHISASGAAARVLVSDIAMTDIAPSSGAAAPGSTTGGNSAQDGRVGAIVVRTNTSAQVRYRCDSSDASTTVRINTMGWWDYRGK